MNIKNTMKDIIITLLQAPMIFGMTYAVLTKLNHVATELRTKLWIYEHHKDFYFDKWDFIHWGSALLCVLTWPDRKLQKIAAGLGLGIAAGFELFEQIILCNYDFHEASCEPWQDTTKDIFTAFFGIIIALKFPRIVSAVGHFETLLWCFLLLILMPHFWWWGIVSFTLMVIFFACFHENPKIVRIHCSFQVIFGVIVRGYFLGVDLGLILSTVVAAVCIYFCHTFVLWINTFRPSRNNLKNNKNRNISPTTRYVFHHCLFLDRNTILQLIQ